MGLLALLGLHLLVVGLELLLGQSQLLIGTEREMTAIIKCFLLFCPRFSVLLSDNIDTNPHTKSIT